MVTYRGGDIFMNRNDDVDITITIYIQPEKEIEYEIKEDDKLTFSLLKEPTVKPIEHNVIFEKPFDKKLKDNNDDDDSEYIPQVTCHITCDDTRYLNDSEFYYIVRLYHGDLDYTETVTYGRLFLIM